MKCAYERNKERKIKSEATSRTVEYMLLAFIQFLGDKRGWKQDSIASAVKYCIEHAEAIEQGYTTIAEAREDVWETYGFKFTDDGRVYCEPRKI